MTSIHTKPWLASTIGNRSILGEFDSWVRDAYIETNDAFHRGLWAGWCRGKGHPTLPYPGTEHASQGTTCKQCDGEINRADPTCPHCGKVFAPDPDYPARVREGS